jgi:aquaporin NIP
MQPELSKRLMAEAIGTFGFFFIGFCGIAAAVTQGPAAIQSLGIALGFGFGLGLMIFAFGHISGGHYNPAVSAGLAAADRFPREEVVPYWGAQLAGGLVAALAVRAIFSHFVVRATVNAPGVGISGFKALVLETILTFLFVLVICTVATDERAPWKGVFAPFAIGLFIFVAATTVGPLSGGSFNPARSIDPAVVALHLGDLWIYIIGPLVGGILGGLVHGYFREPA